MKTGIVSAALLVAAASVFAARMPEPPKSDPHSSAVSFYQSGERHLDKAARLASELKGADAQAAAKTQQKLNKSLENALADFRRATDNDPMLYAAYSEMGFALRKLGRYDESLQAYDKALSMEPGFSPAIEYRAEAYLGLNRIDDARQAYLLLFSGDRPRADLLLGAMKSWVEDRRTNAAGVDAGKIEQFGAWVTQREAIHSQNPSVASSSSANIRTW